MVDPVDLFELAVGNESNWALRKQKYEAALTFFERGLLAECQQACQQFTTEFGASDGPANWLLARVNDRLASGNTTIDPVFNVETK